MAMRMKPSQLQTKMAAPASTGTTPGPNTGVRFAIWILGMANVTNTARRTS